MFNYQLIVQIQVREMKKLKHNLIHGNLNISFNSKYLIDIASEVEDKNLKNEFKRFSFSCS